MMGTPGIKHLVPFTFKEKCTFFAIAIAYHWMFLRQKMHCKIDASFGRLIWRKSLYKCFETESLETIMLRCRSIQNFLFLFLRCQEIVAHTLKWFILRESKFLSSQLPVHELDSGLQIRSHKCHLYIQSVGHNQIHY